MSEDIVCDDELERALADRSKLTEKAKHRGWGNYERRGIYRGPVIRSTEENK